MGETAKKARRCKKRNGKGCFEIREFEEDKRDLYAMWRGRYYLINKVL